MAQQVLLHIGLPKTGTTYLQSVLRSNADHLARSGLLYVGDNWFDHANASAIVRELPRVKEFGPRARESWERLRRQALDYPGRSALFSHEYFCAASSVQVQRTIDDLQPSEVHLILTVRDLPSLLTAAWQQEIKKHGTEALSSWWPEDSEAPESRCTWRTLDTTGVLQRWAAHVPPQHVHIVTVPPPGTPPEALLHRFAEACSISLAECDLSVDDANTSLGVVAVELKRRVNNYVRAPIQGWREVPRWLRDYLAGEILSRYGGERFRLADHQISALADRTEALLDFLRRQDFRIEGDLDDLRVRKELSDRRTPDDVTESELADLAAHAIADLVQDVRSLTRENAQLRRRLKRRQQEQASHSR